MLPHDNLKFTLNSHPKILVLSNDVDANGNQVGVIDAGDTWHTDHQFKNIPPTVQSCIRSKTRHRADIQISPTCTLHTKRSQTKSR